MKRELQLIFVFIITIAFLPLVTAQSNTLENQIRDSIQQNQKQALAQLEKIVNINSGTDNIAGVHQVGEILRLEFKRLGFTTHWVAEPPEMHRAATLIAERQGTVGKRLLLIGHLDTVFSAQHPFQTFTPHGDTVTGPGVIDDKGGDIVILYALKALHENHLLDNTSITVVLTGDEEDSGKPAIISRKPLIDVAKHSDVALDFEFAMTKDTASIARRGVTMWKLQAQGKEAHAADIFQPEVGYGAIFETVRILNTLREQIPKTKYLSFNPGLIAGGTNVSFDKNRTSAEISGKDNVVAKTTSVYGDFRYLFDEQKETTKKMIIDIVKQHLAQTTASIEFEEGIPPMPPTAHNQHLLEIYSKISRRLGLGAVKALDPKARGAGDISYIAALVPANLVGLGPSGSGAHSAQETLDVASLSIQTQRAALLIYQLTHGTKG